MFKNICAVASVACIALTSSQLQAFEDADEAIEYRQAVFSLVAAHFGEMGAMVKGKSEFDAKAFAYRADSLEALAKMPLEGFTFPGAEKGDTKAKSAVWKEMDKFKSKLAQFQQDAVDLASIAESGDMGKIKPVFLKAAKNCKGCHTDFKNR